MKKKKKKDFEHFQGPLLAFLLTLEMQGVGNEHMPNTSSVEQFCYGLKKDYLLVIELAFQFD